MIYNFEKLTFQILSAGKFEHKPGRYSVAGRPYAALGYRLCGSGCFKVGDTEFVSKAGDVLFIAEGAAYEVEYSTGESAVLHLTECNYQTSENISVKNNQLIAELFLDLCNNFDIVRKTNYVKSGIYNILQTVRNMTECETNDETTDKCVEYIDSNFCRNDLSVKEVCLAGNISEATLLRKFRKYREMSPKQYLIKKRLDKAVKLLLEGDKTVAEISLACGFGDPKYMSRAIKTHFGISPSELKNQTRI